MSLCYDFQKWTIMTMLAILTVCLIGMVNLVFGQNQTAQEAIEKEKQRQLELDKYRKMIQEDIKKHNETYSAGQSESQKEYFPGYGPELKPLPPGYEDAMDPTKSQLACVIQGGKYYILDGEGHCLILK